VRSRLVGSSFPSVPKKKFHLWITLWIPWDMSSCTSEEQVTLHIENCMGCPHFHKWKFKWNFSKSHGISLVPYTHFSYGLSRAGDTSQVKSLVKIKFFPWVFTYEITCKWHVPSEITCENQNFSHEFLLIEFKIHKFVYTFKYILIK